MKAQFEEKRIEPNSGLGAAINYLLRRWDRFTLFLRLPGVVLILALISLPHGQPCGAGAG